MREQQKSKTYRYGEPEAHKQAVKIVLDFLDRFLVDPVEETGFQVVEKWDMRYDGEFIKKEKMNLDAYKQHEYDIVILSNAGLSCKEFCFIEVDGEKHSKRAQILNDQRAERFIDHKFKGTVPVIRLLVREVLGTKADRELELREKLGGILLR